METTILQPAEPLKKQSCWVKTPVANLVRYKRSGIFFARVRMRGKLFRQSLKTNVMSVAKLRLRDFIANKQEELGDDSALTGKMTVADCVANFRQRLEAQQDIKEGAKVYRRKCIVALLKSWPELEFMPVGKVAKDHCSEWARKFAAKYSTSVYNNTVGTLRMVFDVAVEKGARAQNPARFITKRKISQRKPTMPETHQFDKFVTAIEEAGAWCSGDASNLVRFLAFGGFRKTEAANITWEDIDFPRGQIRVRVTKNGEPRFVPMIPDMTKLLQGIREEQPDAKPRDPVMSVKECQKAMDNAAKKIGMLRITHHDLRHLFATRCIESGVDIPTVSRWLGHKDGGALAMKVYGHLRDQHSASMAQKVTFTNAEPTNVIPMSEAKAS